MSDLTALQLWIAERLQQRRALDRDPAAVAAAKVHLTGNDRLLPVEQLEIYREQFWLRHTASLVEDFPGVGGILGQEDWERLVEGYLAAHPPESFTLRELGRHFPEYIRNHDDLPHRPLCTDMARLEWRFIELFDAPDHAPLDLQKVLSSAPGALEDGRIVLSPALALLAVDYPVAALRERLLARRNAEGERAPIEIPERSPEHLVLYRGADRRLYHRPIFPEAFALLEALGRGEPLVTACQTGLERAPEHAARLERNVSTWFQDWVKRGWIVDVTANVDGRVERSSS